MPAPGSAESMVVSTPGASERPTSDEEGVTSAPESQEPALRIDEDGIIDDPLPVAGAELMHRLSSGDRDALEQAYRSFGSLVHTIAVRTLRQHQDAEDVTQQVFVELWQRREALDPRAGSLPGWLVTVTRRRCVDAQRARARRARLDEASSLEWVGQHSPDPASVVEQMVALTLLESLGEPRASIVRMAVLEERRHHEIAADLNLPLGTVKSHVRRGLLQLRRHVEEVRS